MEAVNAFNFEVSRPQKVLERLKPTRCRTCCCDALKLTEQGCSAGLASWTGPSNYPQGLGCVWAVSMAVPAKREKLTFKMFGMLIPLCQPAFLLRVCTSTVAPGTLHKLNLLMLVLAWRSSLTPVSYKSNVEAKPARECNAVISYNISLQL